MRAIDEDVKLTGVEPEYPPAPPLLILLRRLERWNALPCEGGFLDQPCRLMTALDVVRLAAEEWGRISAINAAIDSNSEPTDTAGKSQPLPGLVL